MPGPRNRPANPNGNPPARPPGDGDGAAPTPPTVQQMVDHQFARLDGNDDGALTAAEMLAVLDPQGTRTEVATRVAALVAAADADRGGSVSPAELTTLLSRLDTDHDGSIERSDRDAAGADAAAFDLASVLLFHRAGGGPREPAPKSIADAATAILGRFDGDANASISLAELLQRLDPRGDRDALEARIVGWLPAADSNGDQSISQAELTAALTRVDADHDGLLERAELHPQDGSDATVALIGVLLHAGGHHGPGFDG